MKLAVYSNYEIDIENGTIWSYKLNRYIGAPNDKGYMQVSMVSDNGEYKCWKVHRLIWFAANGNIPVGMQINHLDENPQNNSIDNLSLVTPSENINWGTRNKRVSDKLSQNIISVKDNKIQHYFLSAVDAQNKYGFTAAHICACCNGKRKTHKGYQWQYVEDYLADWWDKEMDKYIS